MIVSKKVNPEELRSPFTKAVVDIKKKKLSLDCELHVDCQEELLQDGSSVADTWGLNIYPDGRLDYISMINIRPHAGNRSIEIEKRETRVRILEIVRQFFSQAHD